MIAADQMMARIPATVRAVAAACVLSGLIVAMLMERASILRSGTTVRLATTPVDPRDLFRGDYVVLRYEISEINLTKIGISEGLRRYEPVHVGVRAGSNGRAEVARLARKGEPRGLDLIWLDGTAFGSFDCNGRPEAECRPGDVMTQVTYGLESYFVPEGHGKNIETTEASRVDIIAAVAPSGKAAIKSLLIDGKPVYDEPPY
jgi:uncharacterized membrane-anchored protein